MKYRIAYFIGISAEWIWGLSLIVIRFYQQINDITIGHGGINPLSLIALKLLLISIGICIMQFLITLKVELEYKWFMTLASSLFTVLIPILLRYFYMG